MATKSRQSADCRPGSDRSTAGDPGRRLARTHFRNVQVGVQEHFVYDQTMDAGHRIDDAASRIAAAIGEAARARMLYCLLDNHARTSTELAVVANISPSTASVHLNRLKAERLVRVLVQGKHRYYSLSGADVARVLEGLSVLAGGPCKNFVPGTPSHLRVARTCYDHIAGTLGVSLHDRFAALGWMSPGSDGGNSYSLTPIGTEGLVDLGIDLPVPQTGRRRFAYACLDWSERRSHIGGALGAALFAFALKRRWVEQQLDSRALSITTTGRREMLTRLGLHL
jgi:DNA-binding transcriptional ArsR family regulator